MGGEKEGGGGVVGWAHSIYLGAMIRIPPFFFFF